MESMTFQSQFQCSNSLCRFCGVYRWHCNCSSGESVARINQLIFLSLIQRSNEKQQNVGLCRNFSVMMIFFLHPLRKFHPEMKPDVFPEDNIREWTGVEFGMSQSAVEDREKWRKLVAKSFVMPQRPSQLRNWWWWWWWMKHLKCEIQFNNRQNAQRSAQHKTSAVWLLTDMSSLIAQKVKQLFSKRLDQYVALCEAKTKKTKKILHEVNVQIWQKFCIYHIEKIWASNKRVVKHFVVHRIKMCF